jgi:hypothetical protein
MKFHYILFLSLLLSSFCVFAQEVEKEKKIIPIEFTLSLNRTTLADENTQDRFGFGAGAYFRFFNPKRCHLVVGLEYNRNNLFIEYMTTNGKWGAGNYNTTYGINNIGIPVSFRVNMGKKAIFFIETGVFFDLFIFGREQGTYKVFLNTVDSTTTNIDRSFENKIFYKMPNFGLLGGIGLRIPIQKWEIILKGDYKWGIRDLTDIEGYVYSKYWRFSVGFKMPFGLK